MHRPSIALVACVVVACLSGAGAARGQSSYSYSLAAYYGLGGSADADPDSGFSNDTFQLGLNVNTDRLAHLGVRVGTLGLDGNGAFGDLLGADLTYLTVGGEYRYRADYYESGVYLALGAYRLEGKEIVTGRSVDDSKLGLALGLTGEFAINRRWSVLLEISGHYADFDVAQVFAMAHLGVGYRF